MATFKYELQNVLNLRHQQEKMKQKEYAQSLEVLKSEAYIKKQIDQSLDKSRQIFKDSLNDYIDPKLIKSQQSYHTLLENKQVIAAANVEKAKEKTEAQRQELLTAMKNRKTLEILKEKSLEEYKEQEKRDEQQVVDEIVSFAYTKSE